MRNWSAARVAAAGALIVTGMFATIGEGSTGSTGKSGNRAPNAASKTGDTTAGSTAAGAGSEGADKAKPIPLGTQIKVSSGWEFKVNSANLNATDQIAQGNEFVKPDAGKQFVLVNVTMINKSGKPDAPLTNVKMSLLPPSGVAIDSDIMGGSQASDNCVSTTQLQPDAEYTCNEVYQVKTEEADASLLLVEPVFTINENGAQRFFALK